MLLLIVLGIVAFLCLCLRLVQLIPSETETPMAEEAPNRLAMPQPDTNTMEYWRRKCIFAERNTGHWVRDLSIRIVDLRQLLDNNNILMYAQRIRILELERQLRVAMNLPELE